ncbi:hypothetical protein Lal_00028265 [Lupinus albus]|nr:hypothetical protein Lal_00028265 [Lupinus albus]
MATNLTECVNGVLNGSRALPIEMKQQVLNENNCKATCQSVRSCSRESGVFEVEVPGRDGSRLSKCECGEFQSLRLTCSHVIATCASLNLDYCQFISPIYWLDNLLKVYGHAFEPISNEEYWPHYSGPIFIPNPLMRRNQTRRQKTSSIHNEMDDCALEPNKNVGCVELKDTTGRHVHSKIVK